MMRVVIENVLLFLLPTVIYVAYVLLTRSESTAGTVINEAPLVWLFLIGAMCVAATLIYYATITPGGTTTQTYIPPSYKNGKIEPGQLK